MHHGRSGSDVCHLLRDFPLHRAAKVPPADKLVAHALLPQKFFYYISGIISLVLLGGILGFIDYGHTHYSDRLMVMQLNQQEFKQSLEVLPATEQMRASRWKI